MYTSLTSASSVSVCRWCSSLHRCAATTNIGEPSSRNYRFGIVIHITNNNMIIIIIIVVLNYANTTSSVLFNGDGRSDLICSELHNIRRGEGAHSPNASLLPSRRSHSTTAAPNARWWVGDTLMLEDVCTTRG